jgi:hypothetical protein
MSDEPGHPAVESIERAENVDATLLQGNDTIHEPSPPSLKVDCRHCSRPSRNPKIRSLGQMSAYKRKD